MAWMVSAILPLASIREATMSETASGVAQATIDVTLSAIFVSLELSRDRWMITSPSPGKGEKMSKHSISGGDMRDLLNHFATLRAKAQARTGKSVTAQPTLCGAAP